jgi:DNA polymerase-3 subunit delta'
MTPNAANSLLKTLEEPPGNALLILVVDRAGRLPATIVSRCQPIDIVPPPIPQSLAWLNECKRSEHWAVALRQAGNAPLRALLELEKLEDAATLGHDLVALVNREALPLDTVTRWLRLDTGFVLEWLCREIQFAIRRKSGEAAQAGASLPDSVLQRMDRRKLFCYLDTINRIRSQLAGSYNVQLTLESLLIDWANGLRGCRPASDSGSMRLTFAR